MIKVNTLRVARCFGTEALNLRITDKDPLTKERLDNHLDRYGHIFRAFVLKRRLLRSEIWPKIHIIDGVPAEEAHHLGCQGLFSIKKSMRDEMMMAIAKNDPSKINSAFIISNFSEDHFKQMLDEYVGKVLVCGKAPADGEAQQRVEEKAKELYWAFYFGEKRSPLERELEQAYLSAKQNKSMRSERLKGVNQGANKHLVQEVRWSEREQRILEQKKNWQPTDPNLSDLNFRTFFQSLEYPSRMQNFLRCQKLILDWTWFDDLKFRWFTSRYYSPKSSKYYDWVQDKIFLRVMSHLRSTQFAATLNIPHDYMISAQMVQIHLWLIMDRLKKIGTVQAVTLANRINFVLRMEIIRSSQSVNLKKSNVLAASLQRMLEMNNSVLEMHFNRSELTKNNLYRGIDAMVWSIAFAEKVHRYSNEVYLFSDYLIQNFNHLQRHTEADIFNGMVEFDSYLVNPNYRQMIERVNPPLPAAEFERQFNSNSANKDYYYSKIQKEMQSVLTVEQRLGKSKVDTSFSLAEFLQPFRNLRMKYLSLGTMDHYGKMEEQKKETEKLDKKGTWKTQTDAVKDMQSEFESIKNIKSARKKIDLQKGDKKS